MANITALQAMQARIAELEAKLAESQRAVEIKAVAGVSKKSNLPYKGVQLSGPGRPVYLPQTFAQAIAQAIKSDPTGFATRLENAAK